MADNQVEIIEGEVTQAFAPSKNDEGKWRPANIYIETAEGKVKISEFPKSDYDTRVTYEPIQMPGWYRALGDLENLAGVKVQVAASYKSTFEGTREYNKIQTFKVLSGLPTPQPTPATTATPAQARAARPPSAYDENQMRIMRQSTLGYAATVIAPVVKDFATPLRMVEATIQIGQMFLSYVLTGEIPSHEDAPEQPVQAQEPNTDPEPDVDYPGEDDIASNMGVMEV
tara:strand:+ start:278 stop:961 length:684 start_codon:yes stop_codon:yes gene_type:complete